MTYQNLPGRRLVRKHGSHVINIPKADWSNVKNKRLTATPCQVLVGYEKQAYNLYYKTICCYFHFFNWPTQEIQSRPVFTNPIIIKSVGIYIVRHNQTERHYEWLIIRTKAQYILVKDEMQLRTTHLSTFTKKQNKPHILLCLSLCDRKM